MTRYRVSLSANALLNMGKCEGKGEGEKMEEVEQVADPITEPLIELSTKETTTQRKAREQAWALAQGQTHANPRVLGSHPQSGSGKDDNIEDVRPASQSDGKFLED